MNWRTWSSGVWDLSESSVGWKRGSRVDVDEGKEELPSFAWFTGRWGEPIDQTVIDPPPEGVSARTQLHSAVKVLPPPIPSLPSYHQY